jgi:hypothetical protein
LAGYTLLPNEVVLLEQAQVFRGGVSFSTNSLQLTNLNLILWTKGALSSSKTAQVFPLRYIKMYDGEPQVRLANAMPGQASLEVNLVQGVELFRFNSKKDVMVFVSKIREVFAGMPGSGGQVNSGTMGDVASALGDTVNAFREALGMKPKPIQQGPVSFARACTECGAPISGRQGTVTACAYCDSPQQF